MEHKTYVVYYTPTLTVPDPEPDVITGVLLSFHKGVVKFDVGTRNPMVLVGVEKVVDQKEPDKCYDDLIESSAMECEPNWRLADGSKGWLWFDSRGNKKVTWCLPDGKVERTSVQ